MLEEEGPTRHALADKLAGPLHLKAILSINDEMVGDDALLADGDVLSIIPQVAGG